jgi:hypothetical protein
MLKKKKKKKNETEKRGKKGVAKGRQQRHFRKPPPKMNIIPQDRRCRPTWKCKNVGQRGMSWGYMCDGEKKPNVCVGVEDVKGKMIEE